MYWRQSSIWFSMLSPLPVNLDFLEYIAAEFIVFSFKTSHRLSLLLLSIITWVRWKIKVHKIILWYNKFAKKIPKEDKLMDKLIISIFYEADNFCKEFNNYLQNSSLRANDKEISAELHSALSLSEVMTICIVFHLSGYRTFKRYYTQFISKRYKKFFPRLVSYNRFAELMPSA